MKMIERRYTVRFLTPAFLGDAEQNGRWRTPPFKHLLREWWRVAYAADHSFNVSVPDMRREEGLLFGNAWLTHRDERNREVSDYSKSLVRLRLDWWDKGKLTSWTGLEQGTVLHPEVQKTGFKVSPHAYLGYGPLDGRGNTKLSQKVNAAIQAGEIATLSLAYPTTHDDTELKKLLEANVPRLEQAYVLMHRYGTLGGRSRNGWGSYQLEPSSNSPKLEGKPPLRPWRDCLDSCWDWPHAIGQDEKGPLIWKTSEHTDWKALMRTLAIIKIGLRTQFAFPKVRPPHRGIEPRHWLSYPITTHTTSAWDRDARLPNQLRFKIRQTNEGKLVGVIFHMPHLPPAAFNSNRTAIEAVWRCVHEFLDELTKVPTKRSYASCRLADREALAQQKQQLDSVTLKRIAE